jgi:RNA polymerase sigma-70 factor, ECF subfamily
MIWMIGLLFGGLVPFARRAASPSGDAVVDPSAALVARAIGGERRAFDDLYRLHVAPAYRLLTRLVGSTADRDDLIQLVFLEAFRSLPGFRGDAAFSTWLHRIVVHVAYRHLRREKRVRWDEAPVDAPATAASPETSARRHEELDRALRYLSALKPDKRIAFVLRVVEGMTLDEIGNLVGATAPAVGQRVKHAQRELAAMAERDRRRTGEEHDERRMP